ncbi:MAG: hypothetical protein F6J92_22570 [Symploca sp. SIO1A3]|nr:hypothetical protein [Symploca sp. SIO1A3]
MRSITLYLSCLLVCLIAACTSNRGQPEDIASAEECPQEQTVALKPENVKLLSLTQEELSVSGNVRKNKPVGYTFEAEAEQELKYQTAEEVCVWFYTPDNQLLSGTVLPTTGKYTVQVAIPQGSANFSLKMSLGTKDSAPDKSPSEKEPRLTTSTTALATPQNSTPNPEKEVAKYYSLINTENYRDGWYKLTVRLREEPELHPKGYDSYTEWWTQINNVDVLSTSLIEQEAQTATVDSEVRYFTQGGRQINQSLRFSFIWDSSSESWLIDRVKRL